MATQACGRFWKPGGLRSATLSTYQGNCWDNAVAESFFGTVKTELVHLRDFATREDAKTTIVEWIEVFYNRERLQSTLNYLSPVQFEEQYWSSLQQSTQATAA
ncbi:IS3 family transposase [Leptolyngbya sp. 7M]|nr:IS3 family transposase [Leptolyngbya sp. 7M]